MVATDGAAGMPQAQQGIALLVTDFTKFYEVYLFRLRERDVAAKLFMTVAAAPWALYSVFGIVKESVDAATVGAAVSNPAIGSIPSAVASGPLPAQKINFDFFWHSTPDFILVFFLICGIFGLVAFQRFIDAHTDTYKMIRYINGFRLNYHLSLEEGGIPFRDFVGAELDPQFPGPRRFFHWATPVLVAMALIDTGYVWFSVAKLDNSTAHTAAYISSFVVAVFHIWFYGSETKGDFKKKARDYDTLKRELLNSGAYLPAAKK